MRVFALIALLSGAHWLTASDANAQCAYATYYAPVYQPVVAYRPMTAYYAPAVPVAAPTAYYTTRYRPLRGGYVTRVRYGYAPAYYYGW